MPSGVGGTIGLAYYLDPSSTFTPGFSQNPSSDAPAEASPLFGTNQQSIFQAVGTVNAIRQQQASPVGPNNVPGTQSYFIKMDFTK